ncbi:MAG: hypothetical protein ABI233_08900 [Chthoniobacterales bacterium]
MSLPNEPEAPKEKKLRFASFAIHATRGLVRDQQTRRMTMFVLVIVALVMLFLGATFLAPVLDPHLRPGWFIFYWAICAWITMTAVLLTIFDLLMVRARGRGEKRRLQDELAEDDEAT